MTAKPDIEKIYSLSPMQEGMLYHALLDNQSQAYFEQSVFTINGPMDRGLLEKSFTRLIGRHPVLRTVFVHEKLKKPMQVVLKNVTPEPGFADISHLPAGEKENRLEAFKKEDREKGFDLVKGPPIRMLLIKTGERAYRLLLSFHHIIMDGWCLGIIFKDLIQIYHSLSQGKPVHLEPVTPYADYIKWLKQQDSEKGLSYWRKYLAGYEQQTSLPKARESHDYQPEEYGITLDGSLTGKITEIAEQHRLTVNTFFQALWGVLLQAYNNTGDVVFGAVVSGRPPEIKGIGHMVGLFINTVPVRVKTTGTATFSQLTRQMQEHSLLSKAYEYLPLAETQVNTAPGTHLIDHIMIFQNYPVQREIGLLSTLGEIGIEIRDIQFREQTNYDLNITIGPDTTGDTLTVRFEFNSLVYTRDFISGIAITFKEMVKQVVENFDTAVREIEIISDEEKKQVLFDFNNTSREFPKDKTMNQLFTAQAERTPEKIAVVGPLAGGGNIQFISFKELNRKSNQLAQLLMRKNLCPDSIVGIMVRRSIDMFIGILGILKAGGAYLPIDPGYPGERIRYMLKDSAAKMMVSSRYLAAEVENIFLEELSSSSQTPDLLPSQPQNTSNLAYIIYTSGTTGVPKGVAVEHRNVAANLFAFYREFEITQSDTVIQLNSFAFDAFIEEVFPVLLRGGKIAVPPATQMPDIRFLCNFITMHHVTIIDSTPLLLNELNHCTRLESVRIIISGGDILKKEYINHFLTSGKVYNTYGPTEATVCATYYRLPGEVGVTSNIPIGSPIANYKIYILAKNGALQPIGVPGELCIEGAGVTRGYLNSPQLTAEKFTTNPVTGQGVIYRSGDLARWLAGGNIEFLGRIDSQVKIRGYRIETGEIQSLLAKHEDINDAVVTAGADSRGEKYLCAYIVPHSPHSPHSPKLREYLSRSLPEYMVPSFFIEIEKIPLTSNGKLDKKALPGPGVPAGDSYVPPTDETQELLVGIWSEILGIEKNRIGIDTGFLDLGGHSLKAILLVSRIHKETDVKLPLAEIFAMSTIRRMAETIKNAAHEKHTAVEPAEEKAYYPPSPAQKRMYILNRMEPESTGYNITTVVQLEGALDMGRLEHGFLQLISRHESLRTSFPLIGDDPVQQVHTPGDVEFKIERGIPALLEEFVRPFDLSRAPLLRAAVLEIDARRRLLAMDTHHIVSDGVSAVLLVKDLVRFYEGEFLPPLTLQYKDYAQWLNRRKREGALEEQGAYWLKQFEGEIPVLNLPTDFARPTIQDFGGTHFSFELPRRETALLKAAALEEGTTLYVVLVAVFNILLSRLSGQEDIVVGTPTMGRRHADIQQIAGMFVNTLALRNFPSGEKTVSAFLKEIKTRTLAAFENQEYPFEELVDRLGVSRDVSRSPLFDVMFAFQDMEMPVIEIPSLKVSPYRYDRGVSVFDLSLFAGEQDQKLVFTAEYAVKLFEEETIKRFFDYFKRIAVSAAGNRDIKIAAVEILSGAEKEQLLYEFNDTEAGYPADKTIHELFEEQASQTPDRIAINMSYRTYMTYSELNRRSDRLARFLGEKGVRPGTIVGIMMGRSIEMVTGIFAVLKAGGAYMPIDPGYPRERIDYMLKDSGADVLLGEEKEEILNASHPLTVSSSFLQNSSSLAYVIYTSGSTGNPKGVMVEHRSVVNLLTALDRSYPLGENDVYLLKTSYLFDVSVSELFGWFMGGGRLAVLERGGEREPGKIVAAVYFMGVTHINFVPSMFNAFVDWLTPADIVKLAALRYIFLAGEALTSGLIQKFRQLDRRIVLENIYGPTEATVYAAQFPVSRWNGRSLNIPIGRPLQNVQLYILDKNDNPQPLGVPGMLHIAGAGLARGYLNRPELTSKSFSGVQGAVFQKSPLVYKTGDLARWLPGGNIEFLGRIDHQVKVRGFRIELGEIENRLLKHEAVKETVVLAKSDNTGGNYLCAYVVPHASGAVDSLREYLSGQLPGYMVPAYFVTLDQLPATATGKIDRTALPEPLEAGAADTGTHAAPRNPLEELLAETWGKVLGRKETGIDDNFFMSGGDSIKTIQIASRMNKAGYKLEMKDIFRFPTIRQLAPKLKKVERTADQSIVTGTVPLTPIQHWFFENKRTDAHRSHYNQAVMLYSEEGFDEAAVRAVFTKIQLHHDALRMTFSEENGGIVQTNHGEQYPLDVRVYDLRGRERAIETLEAEADALQASIDLNNGPLMKIGLFKARDGDRLLTAAHHSVIDGISWRILLEDIETLYRQFKNREPLDLPLKSDSFKVWAEKLTQYAAGSSREPVKEKTYWENFNSAAASVPAVPKDFENGGNFIKDHHSQSFRLSEEETLLMLTRANEAFRTEINDILLTAFGLAVRETYGHSRVSIALEGHGREDILPGVDISRTVGWFTSLYPVLLDVSYGNNDLARQIKVVKEHLHRVPNKGTGYGILKYLTREDRVRRIPHIPAIVFNYLGQFDQEEELSTFSVAKEYAGNTRSGDSPGDFEMEVNGMVSGKHLEMSVTYSRKQYKEETVQRLLENYKTQLRRIISFCSGRAQSELTPCDLTFKELSIEILDRLGTRYAVQDIYTLGPMQEGMLFHSLYETDGAVYFELVSYRIHGELNISYIEKSLNKLFTRYDVLRTAFIHEGFDRPVQLVLKDRRVDFYYRDIREMAGESREAFIKEFKEKDRQRSFDPAEDVLMRVAILQTAAGEYEFTWSHHHILMDGWCIGILISEFFEIYNSYLENRDYRLPPARPYREYIEWLEKRDKEESKQYWTEYLEGYTRPAGFSKTTAPAAQGLKRRKKTEFSLDTPQTHRLKTSAANNHVTLYSVVQAAWGVLLGKYTGRPDVVFGGVVSGRPSGIEGVETMVGLFINTIPVRFRYRENNTLLQLVKTVHQQSIDSEPHHYYPLADIQAAAPLKQKLFDHILVFLNYPIDQQIGETAALTISGIESFEQSNFDLEVAILSTDRFTVSLDYNANVYDGALMERVADNLKQLLSRFSENEETAVSELSLLTGDERNDLIEKIRAKRGQTFLKKTAAQKEPGQGLSADFDY